MTSRRNRQRSPEPSGGDEESELMSVILAGNRIRVTNTRVSFSRSCSVHSAIFSSLQSQPTATKVGSMKAEFSSADGQRSAAFDRQSVLIGRIGGHKHSPMRNASVPHLLAISASFRSQAATVPLVTASLPTCRVFRQTALYEGRNGLHVAI